MKHKFYILKPLFWLGASLWLSLITINAWAGEVDLNAGLSSEYIKQSVDDVDNNLTADSDNLIIKPFISFAYDARYLDFFVNVEHNHIQRSFQDANVTNNFTSYRYRGDYQIVPNLLALRINGSQDYQSFQENSFLVDDFLLNQENLGKRINNTAALTFALPEGDYIGINAQAAVRDSKLERLDDEQDALFNTNFDSFSYNAAIDIIGGRDLRPFIYKVDLSLNNTDRQDQQNFESERAKLMLGSYLSSDISLRLLGSYENNELTNENLDDLEGLEEGTLREFYSYGAGLAWQPSANRFIELGYNRSVTTGLLNQEDQENDFLSIDVNWNFSGRTSISGNYSRRFFGNAGEFSFKHTLRNWRSSITYSEDVNTNSQLGLAEEDGAFFCPGGSTDISQCFIPDQINPDNLGPGEFLVPFVTRSLELNDRVIIRKNLIAQTAVERRRTTITASISARRDQEVELVREMEDISGALGITIKASPRSTIKLDTTYSDVETSFEGELFPSITKEFSLEFERRMTRRLFASFGFRYLDRNGEVSNIFGGLGQGTFGITGPLTDRRITAEIRYEFDRKR